MKSLESSPEQVTVARFYVGQPVFDWEKSMFHNSCGLLLTPLTLNEWGSRNTLGILLLRLRATLRLAPGCMTVPTRGSMYNLIKRSVPDVRSGRTNLVASRSSYVRLLFIVLSVALFAMSGYAQSITGTLTGTVTDPSGAVVPQAKVNLKNEGSGDLRRSVSNSDGFFTFAAVPAGIYEVTIEAPGFLNYRFRV
jgi:hypothetical protein